jgi:hypothetical protein
MERIGVEGHTGGGKRRCAPHREPRLTFGAVTLSRYVAKMLDEHQELMASGIIADPANCLKSKLLIKNRRLKAVSLKDYLLAIPRSGFLFDCLH